VESSPREPFRAAWADLKTDEVLPGITRQTVHGAQQTVVRYVYAPGSVFPVHAHPQEQVTVVVSGRIAFEIGGRTLTLAAGDVAIIPGNTPHGARVIGGEAVETFNALSPRRKGDPLAGSAPHSKG
jgi:quercetin dioxygenase-like cupin family protein